MNVIYNDAAIDDLIEIGVYTMLEWDAEQWVKYRALLLDACEQIIPSRLKHAQPVASHPGVLRWRAGRHVVFFRVMDVANLEILRILHERALPSRHL